MIAKIPLLDFRYNCKNFAMVAKFSVLLLLAAACHFFNPGFKFGTQTAKINTRTIKKNSRKVKINLKKN